MTEINYRREASALSSASQTIYSPVSGLLDWALISWPPGCNCRVEVILNHGTVQILPYPPGGIALDAATDKFTVNRQIQKGDPLEVRILNHASDFSHTITVVLNIIEKGSN